MGLDDKEVLIMVEFGKSDRTLIEGTRCAGLMVHSEYIRNAVKELKTLRGLIVRRIKMEEHCSGCEKGFECDTCKPYFDSIRKTFDNKINRIFGGFALSKQKEVKE